MGLRSLFKKIYIWKKKRNRIWDSYCNHCGLCCYEKKYKNGVYEIDLSSPCTFLNENKECNVYKNRFKVCGNCSKLTIFHALFTSYLPDSCGYVQRFRFWRKKNQEKD